ncbi:IS66 family transposase [Desulfosporosinus youngiae]|uniref:IS66 family transposase n=1 Tax=Desulfosporosinus youngiae TaxID=339862 RepID=UPI000A05FF22|nr:transposase [Desulfosporosinus youngiae]
MVSRRQCRVHTDGYEVYHKLNSDITVVGCLAHLRRRFTNCIQSLSEEEKKTTASYEGLQFCDTLFDIEERLKHYSIEERHRKRLALLKPVMDAFLAWLKEMNKNAVPKTHFYEAVNYGLNQWPYFENILLDGRLELSNNLAERSLRPFTIGRKNWVTMETPRGATASAMIYSVLITARNNNLKPYNYLVYVLKQMPNTDFINHPELIEKFVPWSTELPADCYKQDKA